MVVRSQNMLFLFLSCVWYVRRPGGTYALDRKQILRSKMTKSKSSQVKSSRRLWQDVAWVGARPYRITVIT